MSSGNKTDRDELIQKFLDGEVEGEERLEAERLLDEDPEAQKLLSAYRQIGSMLRQVSLTPEVERSLEQNYALVRQKTREDDSGSFWERFRIAAEEFLLYRKRVWIPASATAVAAAVALIVVMSLTGKPGPDHGETGGEIIEEKWSRVTSISLGASSSMVMEIEDGTGTKATILWVLGEPEVRIEDNGQTGAGDAPDAEVDKK